jgi:sugar lactone lactonase YvrE
MSQLAVELRPLCRVGGALLEGPSWDATRSRLLFVDILRAERLVFDWATGALTREPVRETCSAWLPRRTAGSALVCRSGVLLLDDDGAVGEHIPLESGVTGNRSNDAKCDPRGRLWVGTMADAPDPAFEPNGALYRVERGVVTPVLEGVAISNGLGWSPDGSRMYYVDTPTRRIDVLDYDIETGAATRRRPLADVRGLAGVPDGLAVDAEGCLWVAFYDGWAIHRFSPAGAHLAALELAVARPTSCAFAGAALDRLVVTTAAGPEGASADPLVLAPGVNGSPVASYDG